jgi:SAM-dependent methyltransferase/uncharacterized protein YbaR (Trm112 family)
LRLGHFEALRPICPVCRSSDGGGSALTIANVFLENGGHILQAILHCSNPQCQREYPVLDGIPILVGNIREFIAERPLRFLARDNLAPEIESVVGDCLGPQSDFDTVRQQVSAYAWEHYGEFDLCEAGGDDARRGTMLRALEAGMEVARDRPSGPVIDIGCAVGRGTFQLAEETEELVLGVDLHFPMLRLAGQVLQTAIVRYSRRTVGLVYDRREFAAPFGGRGNVDFWCCDAVALPFAPGSFALATGLNILDSVYAPREFLLALAAVLRSGGKAVLACPYDWSSAATPLEGWLGGHSQRSSHRGSSEAIVRSLLTPGASPSSIPGLRLVADRDGLPWEIRLHERSTMKYRLDLLVVERVQDVPA